jgi:hypothetical protein
MMHLSFGRDRAVTVVWGSEGRVAGEGHVIAPIGDESAQVQRRVSDGKRLLLPGEARLEAQALEVLAAGADLLNAMHFGELEG